MGFRNDPGWLLIQKTCTILQTSFLSPQRNNISTPIQEHSSPSVCPGLLAEAEPWLHWPSPPLSVFFMASSSLAPSPQTTITPLRPKRKLCSSTLPPMQLLLSLLLPQTSYTDAHASSLSFSSVPTGIWLLSLPLSPKPWPTPNYHKACSSSPHLRSALCCISLNGHLLLLETLASFSHGPHHPTQVLSSPQCSGVHDPLSYMTGGLIFFSALSWIISSIPFHNYQTMNC